MAKKKGTVLEKDGVTREVKSPADVVRLKWNGWAEYTQPKPEAAPQPEDDGNGTVENTNHPTE